ncbi:c-type cytochrome [Falsiroseomonas tokyonensis]|uniref:C-type cytochrome n=1 Tax=Falsiroseomonas tokyonensis TaxID=430521 RepID=A0ABV7BTF1_9PROT|nr:cytochrome c [Falsiroseomonas tokyonensis]MBU8538912.1 cytochrome c [Falsiroseomonas tokyonensis]
MFANHAWRGLLPAACLLLGLASAATAANLTLDDGTRRVELDTAALLARPDRAEVAIERDNAYRGPMRYQAVPLSALLQDFPATDPEATLEAAATDGFAAQIPLATARATGPGAARAWLAIEPPEAAWPSLPGKPVSAGPFYIVWERPALSGVSPEYWAYQVAALRYVASPARRWPQMVVDAALPADHPARLGQGVYTAVCLSCHRINGAGSADMGPDLNRPMSPVEYFQPQALRRYIRNPSSVRTWPDQKMPGFSVEQISEAQLDGLIAYLEHMAARRPAP